MPEVEVTLGDHTVPVYPQRHAYLTNHLTKFIESLTKQDINTESPGDVIGFLGGRVYDLFAVALPTYVKRCPRWEFMGYGSAEAYEAQEYVEADDKSPTVPEQVTAFEVAARVNRFDIFTIIGKVVDPNLLKSWFNDQLARMILTGSASLPSTNGGSETSTPSGTTPSTSTENEVLLSVVSTDSSPHGSDGE